MKPVHDLALNPNNPDMLVSCSEDGEFGVWSLGRFELMRHFFVANFLKGVDFISEKKIRTWGGSHYIFECQISDGKIVR